MAEVPVAINQGFIAMKPRSGFPSLYLLQWSSAKNAEILSRANGSTFLEISKSNFRTIPAIVPPSAILGAFDRIAGPLHRLIVSSVRESLALAALRDALLPKLISGELRIEEAERFVTKRQHES
jgi:type I restriction enzyme S subunit